jgi:hypothetical protein
MATCLIITSRHHSRLHTYVCVHTDTASVQPPSGLRVRPVWPIALPRTKGFSAPNPAVDFKATIHPGKFALSSNVSW